MPTSKDFSVEDEAYLSAIAAEPKMTMDEVGADIDEHGHVPVTTETATQDPFTAKGSLANALDEAISAETDFEHTTLTRDKNDNLDSHLTNPTDDFRDETKGEVEGTTSTPQGLIQPVESNKVGEGLEPTIQQDKAVQVKDSLAEALDAITMDGAEEIEAKPPIGKDPEPDLSKYDEENASHIPLKAPNIPPSMGGDEDKPDANGLVYVSATFTVDPDKYVSNNYRPTNMGKAPDAASVLKQKSAAMQSQTSTPEGEEAISDLGTPEARESAASPDEPTEQQEKDAAKDADKEQKKELDAEAEAEAKQVIPSTKEDDKQTQDEAPENVVLDYATFIDGSSFICFDEVSDIDYSKIAMDAGPKKAPTRANCQTTFAQCRAKNPLFCRFHGPKLLEADIKTAIKATVGPGCVVQVTKDKNSKNKFTFRLTVGCPPSKKKMVEKMVHMYLTQNPGITSSTEDWNLVGKHKQTQEFEMDILQADNPPKKDTKADQMLSNTKKAIKEHKKQDVVGETAPGVEKKAAKGEKWQTVDEDVENEWADLVDKTVHKSLLGNNEEFLANFNNIANQFDQAHDAGDAAGLKQALESLKEEIGKYDENGEKKPEAETETATSPESPQEQAQAPQATEPEAQTQAQENPTYGESPKLNGANVDTSGDDEAEGNGGGAEASEGAESGESEEVVLPAPPVLSKGNEGEQSTQPAEEADAKKNAAFDKVKKALAGTGYENADLSYEDFGDTQEVYIATSENGEGTLEAAIGKDGGLTFGVHDNNGFWGNSDDPSQAISDFEKNYGGKPPVLSYGGKAHELATKLSGFKKQFQSIVDGGADPSTVDAMNNAIAGAQITYDKLAEQYDAIDEIDKKIQNVENTDGIGVMEKAFELDCLNMSKKEAEGQVNLLLNNLESKVNGIEMSFGKVAKSAADKQKGQLADDVEQQVVSVAKTIFPNGPVEGVDSAKDMVDSLFDETGSELAKLVGEDNVAGLVKKHGAEKLGEDVEDQAKKFDDAIQEFKDAMDTNDIEGAKSKAQEIKGIAGMLMGSFGFLKGKLGMIKAEAEEMAKVNKAKERLAKGNVSQSQGGGKKPVEPFDFDAWQKGQQAQGAQGGEKGMSSDLSYKVGKPFEGLQNDIKPLISNVLSKNGRFTNFDTFDDTSVEGTKHIISMEKKQKEGYDEDNDEESTPTPEELDKLLKQMNEEFSMYGLQVKPSTKMKNSGKNVYFEVEKLDGGTAKQEQAQPKNQLSDEEKKAKIAAMSPKQKLEAAVKIFKKKLAANPNDSTSKAKLAKYEAMLAKLGK